MVYNYNILNSAIFVKKPCLVIIIIDSLKEKEGYLPSFIC